MKAGVLRNLAAVLALAAVLLAIKLFDLLVEPEHVYPGRVAAFGWGELALALAAGLLGAALAARGAVLRLWPAPPAARALLLAAALGALLGAALAGLDSWLRIGDISVGLPLAPVFYLWGAIVQEIVTHFAPVALAVGLVGFATASARVQEAAFWVAAVAMALLAALAMMAAFGNPEIPLAANVAAAPMLIGAAVFAIELALFAMLRARGFAAALTMRLGFYAVWHIAWPALAY